ncbi:MAG: hypothetical protein V3U24_06950 [Candidatus Neomarinimicrobiota bacterium]
MINRSRFALLLPVFAGFLQGAGTEGKLETARSQDTLFVQPGDSILSLSHDLVISGTELVTVQDSVVETYRLESIEGRIVLSNPVRQRETFVVAYEHLTDRFVTHVEPVIRSLPVLTGEYPIVDTGIDAREKIESEENLPLVADGTLFRGISVSPSSGVSLTGGLELALQGKLSKDMTVSGTISDQNMPIQPEGNTRTVEELDKVFLEVKHPSATIVAGDIDMSLKHGRFMEVTRRLEGLKVNMRGEETAADVYVASTKGKFHRMEIRGEDGNQGPYSLFSDHGSRDIIVLASSERTWVDGEKTERGENNDYTIDYSRGEITFTTNQVIDSESRIYVEYEYSDLAFPRRVASTTVTRKFGNRRASVSAGWIRESDNLNTPVAFSLSDGERQQLKQYGDKRAKIETVTRDAGGHYVKMPGRKIPGDSVLVYVADEEKTGDDDYYRVVFHNVGPRGEYARHATPGGQVYFEYLEENDREEYSDLYVPWQNLPSPESHQILNISTGLNVGDSTRAVINLSGSTRDRNLLSPHDDDDNDGYAGEIELSHNQELPRELGHLSLTASTWKTGKHFSPLQRDRRLEFNREWNLSHGMDEGSNGEGAAEQLATVEISHRLGQRSTSSLSLGSYGVAGQRSTRWQGNTSLSFHWIPDLRLDMTAATRKEGSDMAGGRSTWQRERLYAGFLPGRFHPFLRFEEEKRETRLNFREAGGGFVREGERARARLALTHRTDHDSTGSQQGESWLGELHMDGRWRSGYRLRLLLKQKIKSYAHGRDDLNYGLARGNLGYHPRRGIVRADVDFKLEQTLYTQKIVVYDSVGVGQGDYRYDRDYDQFFPDPNGNLVAHHISSGKKLPAAHLTAGIKFFCNFRRTQIPYLKDVTWRVYGKGDQSASVLTWDTFVQPSLSSSSINSARLALQQELNYTPSRTRRRIRISSSRRTDVEGQNSRNGSESKSTKHAFSLEEPVLSSITWVTDAKLQKSSVRALVKARQRRGSGWFLSSGPRWRPTKMFELGTDFRYGKDLGKIYTESYEVDIVGLGVHARLFPRKGGRIQASLDTYRVVPESPISVSLPPESAQGLQIGNTYRYSLTALLVFAGNISANAGLTYLLDPIHDGILTASGEVRASF